MGVGGGGGGGDTINILLGYCMLIHAQLTWQAPPFWQGLGLQSSMFTSQFLPVHPTTQSHR